MGDWKSQLQTDPRLSAAIEFLLSKGDAQGRWNLAYTYNGKTWADVETKGQPSKWITLRALRVLKRAARGRRETGSGHEACD